MAIQDDILNAKQIAQSNIPIYVVPDNQRSMYSSNLLPSAGQLVSKNINNGVFAGYNPGTKTLGGKNFDEGKRSRAVAEALAKEQFDFEKKDSDRKFEYNKMDNDRSYNLALQKAYQSSNEASIKPPTVRENFQAVKNGAISLLDTLLQPNASGEEGAQGFYQEGLSPQDAVSEVVKKLNSQLGGMDLTESEYNSVINMLYYAAGLIPPEKNKSDDSFLGELYK